MAGEEEWMDDDHVVLTDEEGKEHSFEVVDVIEVEGSEYAILTPEEEEADEAGDEAVIFRIDRDENGDEVLVEIEDDDEWERVAAAYDRMVEEEDDTLEEEDDFLAEDAEEDEEDDEDGARDE